MRIADHGHIDIVVTINLFLREDDLRRKSVFGVRDGVVQQANATDDLTGLFHLVRYVRGITVDLLALGRLRSGSDTNDLSAFHDDLVDRLIQHVSAAVDSGKSSEALGKFAQTVQGI